MPVEMDPASPRWCAGSSGISARFAGALWRTCALIAALGDKTLDFGSLYPHAAAEVNRPQCAEADPLENGCGLERPRESDQAREFDSDLRCAERAGLLVRFCDCVCHSHHAPLEGPISRRDALRTERLCRVDRRVKRLNFHWFFAVFAAISGLILDAR